MHEECLKDTEGTVESGNLWRVLKIGWRVGIFLFIQFRRAYTILFYIESVSFYNKNFFKRHSMFGNLRWSRMEFWSSLILKNEKTKAYRDDYL